MDIFNRWKQNQKQHTGQGLSEERAAYIRNLVEQAGKVDDKREVFGAAEHQYRLNPVITMAEVKRHEEKYNVRLPEEYVFFLTRVGDGGAGPYYGLYPLAKTEIYHEYVTESGKPAWIDHKMTSETWKVKMESLEDDECYEQVMRQISSGFHVIGTQGCTFDNLLMNNGSEQGKIVYIDWNMIPDNVPRLTGMTFLDWYENFFLEIIKGNTVHSYGYIRLGTEDELILAFRNADAGAQRTVLLGFYRFSKVSEKTKRFLLDIDNRALDAMRTELLFRFDLNKGIKLFEYLLDGSNPVAAMMCARRLPKEYFERYYERMLYLLYHPVTAQGDTDEAAARKKVLYFLSDCRSLNAKDLMDFVSAPDTDEDDRKTAIYVMGKAADKRDCLNFFINYMKADNYWIAHTALQAVADIVSPQLAEAYEWMWDKYQSDKTMRSNLIKAFQRNGLPKGV